MKRSILILLLSAALLFTACNGVIDVTGEGAAEQIIEISTDPTPFLGKTLRIAGYLACERLGEERYYYVLLSESEEARLGFELRYDGDYPEPSTPVAVTGILMSETVYGQAYIYLQVRELTPLKQVK